MNALSTPLTGGAPPLPDRPPVPPTTHRRKITALVAGPTAEHPAGTPPAATWVGSATAARSADNAVAAR